MTELRFNIVWVQQIDGNVSTIAIVFDWPAGHSVQRRSRQGGVFFQHCRAGHSLGSSNDDSALGIRSNVLDCHFAFLPTLVAISDESRKPSSPCPQSECGVSSGIHSAIHTGRRMLREVEVQDTLAVVADDEEAVEDTERAEEAVQAVDFRTDRILARHRQMKKCSAHPAPCKVARDQRSLHQSI
jgi:hypothetical protein